MKRILVVSAAVVLWCAIPSPAADVSVGVSARSKNGDVKVQVGNPPPAPVVVERETVIVEKHDHGRHEGHHKKKKKKHEKKHHHDD